MKWMGSRGWMLLVCVVLVSGSGCTRQGSPVAEGQGEALETSSRSSPAAVESSPVSEADSLPALDPPDSLPAAIELADDDPAAGTAPESVAPLVDAAADGDHAGTSVSETVAAEGESLTGETAPAVSDATATGHAPTGKFGQARAASLVDEVLFDGWETPRVALVFTGRQYGYLEPCGCAGLAYQKGGLVRRYALLQELKAKGWNPVPIDAGNQIRRFGRQAEIKFQMTVESLRLMEYQAIAYGPDDLGLPAGELVAFAAGDGQNPSPFISANVAIFDPAFTSPFQVVEANGVKIGITAILGAGNQKKVNNGDVLMRDAAEALADVWPELAAHKCDFHVLVAHASTEESIALGQRFPQFSIVLTTGGAGEPTREPEPIPESPAQLIQVGTNGMFAGVVGLFDHPDQPLRYQRVPLDGRFEDTAVMLGILSAYQDRLQEVGFEGLGIRAQPHPTGRTFVGSEVCADCHSKEYDIWKDGLDGQGGPHAKAYHTLLHPPERSHIARNFDPECISCHVVGWNPQKYFPYESGYLSQELTPDKLDVGCENCHSPGSAHVEAENLEVDLTRDEIKQRRQQMALPLDQAEQTCLQCHDLDNSPGFQEKGAFERYWERIRH